MNVYSQVKDRTYDVVERVLSTFSPETTILLTRQANMEPSGTYCIIDIIGPITKIGGSEIDSYADWDDEDISIKTTYTFTAQIGFVGKDSGDISFRFFELLSNPIIAEIYDDSIGLIDSSFIRHIPELRETKWIDKFNMDILFSYATEYKQDVDVIENVTVKEYLIN